MKLTPQAFPTITKCPSCNQDTLHLFDDVVIEGAWLYCPTCQITGDILTFAAELWKSTVYDAAEPFIDAGLILRTDADRTLANYIRAVQKRKAAAALWREAQQQLWNHHDEIIADKLRILGASDQLPGCADFVGVAHFDQIEQFCRDAGKRPPKPLRNKAPMLVLPYYDLPGRESGILCVQYTESERPRKHFLNLNPHSTRRPDAGYWGLHTALSKTWDAIKNAYFVLDDPLAALSLQLGQLRYGQAPLPLAGAYCGPEAASIGLTLPAATANPKFISGVGLTPELISMAANARGYVCSHASQLHTQTPTPTRVLKHLANSRKTATTWGDALKTVAQQSGELALVAFCAKLIVEPEKLQKTLQKFEAHIPAKTRDKILAAVKIPLAGPAGTRQRWKIIARNGAWYTVVGKEIVNGQIAITKIIQTPEHKKYYEGFIDVAGQRIPFFESDAQISRIGLLSYASEICAQRGLALLFDRGWNRRALNVAMELYSPEVLYISDAIGWDDATGEFRFQNYSVHSDGSLSFQPETPLHKRKVIFPAPSDGLPLTLNKLLGAEHEKTLVWNLFAFFIAELLAPAANKDHHALVLPANTFLTARQLAQALNCPHRELLTPAVRGTGRSIGSAAAKTPDWPTLISHGINDQYLAHSIPRYTQHPIWLRGTELTAAVATSYGWHSVSGGLAGVLDDGGTALAALVPRYIQHALRQRGCLGSGNWLENVLNDVHAWLTHTYGVAFNLDHAKNQRLVPALAHRYLARCLYDWAQTGLLDVLPRPRRRDQPNNYLLLTPKTLWINQKAVDRLTTQKSGLAFNWLQIIALLNKQGVFFGEEILHNTLPGFLISADWYLSLQDQIDTTQGTG